MKYVFMITTVIFAVASAIGWGKYVGAEKDLVYLQQDHIALQETEIGTQQQLQQSLKDLNQCKRETIYYIRRITFISRCVIALQSGDYKTADKMIDSANLLRVQ